MIIEQTVQCPYCGKDYASTLTVNPEHPLAHEHCAHCQGKIHIRVHLNDDGGVDGIEIQQADEH